MNFETYLQTVKLRCRPLPPAKQLVHAQIGMVTELGELGDLLKRELAYGKEFDRINLMEECGDFLWYLRSTAMSGHPHQVSGRYRDRVRQRAASH